MAIYTVDNIIDEQDANYGAGDLSLREALTIVSVGDTIQFAAGLSGQTIVLTLGELALTQDVIIDGDSNGDEKADITISGNDVSRVFNITGGTTNLDNLTITDGYSATNGGAIQSLTGTTLNLTNSTVRDSQSGNVGGGIFSRDTFNSKSSTISDNTAGFFGGGIYVFQFQTASFINTTIDGNTATVVDGGGISGGLSTTMLISNSTITNNDAANGSGGGIGLAAAATVDVFNSVIALNSAATAGTEDLNNLVTLVAGSSFFGTDVSIGLDNGGNQDNAGDPLLAALADNGGPVETRAIQDGSSLINAGSNYRIASGVTTDANGNARIVGGTVDIGASESVPVVTSLLDEEADGGSLAADMADGLGLSLRELIFHSGSGDTITFDGALMGQTIVLTRGELTLTQDINIDGDMNGDDKADITIDANAASGIFTITGANTDVDLLSLNLINGSAVSGGAVHSSFVSSVDIIDTTLSGNTGTFGGGAARISSHGVSNVVNSLFVGNSSGHDGGAIYGFGNVTTSVLNIINSTFIGNSADALGGAISVEQSNTNLFNSTIVGNHADADGAETDFGGGIDLYINGTNTHSVINSVIAGNTSGSNYAPNDFGSSPPREIASAGNSFFGTTQVFTNDLGGNINGGGDPLFGELLDNGGTTLTLSPLDGSSLIGAGNNALIPADTQDIDGDGDVAELLPIDGRGGLRIVGSTVDIGAVERIVNETIGGTDGDDNIVGGLGNDTATYKDASAGITQFLLFTGLDTGGAGTDTLSGIENLTGSEFVDRLAGDGGDNILTGNGGDDILKGKGGNDTFHGKGGNDTFHGGDGNDKMVGGAGDDTMFGGDGNDTLIALAGLDVLNGGKGDDFLFGGKDSDTLNGNFGFDNIRGNRGNDVLNGGAHNDTLRGGGQNDILNGDTGDDFLFGENHVDTLFGGSGNDSLTGGVGGGAFDGFTDTFIYKDTGDGGGGFDRIKDFENGIDVMNLQSFGFANFAAVQAIASNSGVNMRINFGGGDVLFVEDFQLADFDAGDVLI